jgi:hypothetical protein
MIRKAADKGYVTVLLEGFRPGGILALQYIDDTLLFSSCDRLALKNLKIVLMLFEKVSGMKIIFNKSEVIPLNLDDNQIHEVAHVLSCPVGTLPFKYLGVPIHFEKMKKDDL